MPLKFVKIVGVFILIACSQTLHSQEDSVDSLIANAERLRNNKPDSAILIAQKAVNIAAEIDDKIYQVKSEHTLGYCYYSRNDFELALEHLQKSLQLSQQLNQETWEALNLNRIGNVYQLKSDYSQALLSYRRALEINERLEDKIQIARTQVNIGTVYSLTGGYAKAIEHMLAALETYEKESDKEGMAWTSLSIARLFSRIDIYDKALQCNELALNHYRALGNQNGITLSLTELANIYYHSGLNQKALEIAKQVLDSNIKTQNTHGQAANYLMIGVIYYELNNLAKANENLIKALELKQSVNDSIDISKLNRYLGEVQIKNGNFIEGFKYLNSALKIARKQGLISDVRDIYLSLSQAYRSKGDFSNALENYGFHSQMKDSINAGEISRLEMQYDFDKREREQELINKEREAKQQAKLERQRLFMLFISIALILAIALALVVFYFLREKQKINKLLVEQNHEILRQKREIEDQKQEIESQRDFAERQRDQIADQQKQITDSIRYASRIQTAVLPRAQSLNEYLCEYFVFYQPKNIVSGDFYWVTPLYDGRIAVAVADCTGHGVPGAFMSMLGITLLKELTALHKKESAGDILFRLRQLVIASLNQTGVEGESHDGMDMSLAIINKNKCEIEYAGAYLPMLIVRRTDVGGFGVNLPVEVQDEYSLYEFKGNKMPIGFHVIGEKPFTTHQISYHPNDVFYMFSDGYTDQFGGPSNLKYMLINFKKLLLSIQSNSLNEQRQIIEQNFEDFKGSQKQVDDILVMGFKV
ncbi:MAG: tetratricopeptide repeat protein [Bacteroidales bacterium]